MNDVQAVRRAAKERLLDASLTQVFGRPAAARPGLRPARPSARRPPPWLAAAVVVLGAGVVVGSWWWARRDPSAAGAVLSSPQPPQHPQDPLPEPPDLPRRIVVDEVEQLDELPDDVVNLVVRLPSAADLDRVARLQHLRQLVVFPHRNSQPSGWQRAGDDPDALAVLARLPALERLQLAVDLPLTEAHLGSLRGLPKLTALSLANAALDSAGVGEALASLHLRELDLTMCAVGAPMLGELVGSGLRRLGLLACPGLDDDAYAAIARMQTLADLSITNQRDIGGCMVGGVRYRFQNMGEAAFSALEALPALVALDLDESEFDDRYMSRLPKGLRRLQLGDHKMRAPTIAALGRLADLEDLTMHQGMHNEEALALITSLRLRQLWLRGWVDDALVRAMASHPTLAEVHLRLRTKLDLSGLAAAPRLRRVVLQCDPGLEWLEVEATIKPLTDAGIEVRFRGRRQ